MSIFRKKITVPVTGCAKGGTSMAAGILRIMGIFMGHQFGNQNPKTCSNEDKAFSALTRKPAETRKLIEERNASHDVWGWKHPGSFEDLPEIHDALRNPHFIFVFRDPAAVLKRHVREYGDRHLADSMRIVCDKQQEMVKFMQEHHGRYKFLPLSYEKTLIKPEQTIEEIADFLTIEITPAEKEACLKYIKPEAGYQPMEEFLTMAKT